jgi:AcrR family transcriptional regulator
VAELYPCARKAHDENEFETEMSESREDKHLKRLVTRRRGRPKGDEVKVAILRAANDLLESKGYAGFTIEAVAARAGAARSSVYRWWPNRAALAIAGFLFETAPKIAYGESGSAATDVRQQMMTVADVYGKKVGRTIAALVAHGQGDQEALQALLAGYVMPRREEAKRILRAGIRNGELRADLDLDVAVDALYGPIWYRVLVPHAPLTRDWASRLADHVMAGFLAPRQGDAVTCRPPRALKSRPALQDNSLGIRSRKRSIPGA